MCGYLLPMAQRLWHDFTCRGTRKVMSPVFIYNISIVYNKHDCKCFSCIQLYNAESKSVYMCFSLVDTVCHGNDFMN